MATHCNTIRSMCSHLPISHLSRSRRHLLVMSPDPSYEQGARLNGCKAGIVHGRPVGLYSTWRSAWIDLARCCALREKREGLLLIEPTKAITGGRIYYSSIGHAVWFLLSTCCKAVGQELALSKRVTISVCATLRFLNKLTTFELLKERISDFV